MINASPRRWAFEHGVLYGLDLDGELAEIRPRVPAEFREVGPECVDALGAAMGGQDAPNIGPRFAGKRRCFAACMGGQIVSYGWVSQSDECIGEQEREIKLQPREAYVWDCATVPAFRNRGLYGALLRYIASTLKREGVRRVWVGTSTSNTASLHAFRTAGFEPALDIIYLRLFGLRCLWTTQHSAANGLGLAAVRALMTEEERARGPLLIKWSSPRPEPCPDEAQPRTT